MRAATGHGSGRSRVTGSGWVGDGCPPDGSSGGGGKRSDCGYILEVEPPALAEDGCEVRGKEALEG